MMHKPTLRPMMTDEEVSAIEDLLLSVARASGNKLDVLEWGAGGSTIHFPRLLRAGGVACTWLSLEYNRPWFDRVTIALDEELRGVVTLKLFDVGNTRRHQRYTPMDEYVAYPASLGRKWDFILVDGRKRRRCLIEAPGLLSDGGRVVLHDAQRPYYHCAFDKFRDGQFIGPRLWVGYR